MINKIISGKTKICGIIGDPVEHTMSPRMQNAAFQAKRLNFVYLPFKVKKEELENAIQGVRALNIRGLNITIPHKVTVLPFLDKIDPLAEKIGAVNTLVNEDGVLKGYNTDATGFLKALLSEKIEIKDKRVLILGSGGAARAIAFSLVEKGASLTILNRHPISAINLAERIKAIFGIDVEALEFSENNLKISLEKADILVNTTSLGMTPNVEVSPIPAKLMHPGVIVFDIIYNPLKTRLLMEAEMRGLRVITGIEMLIWQGAYAFELWTGESAPLEIMRTAALIGVGKDED